MNLGRPMAVCLSSPSQADSLACFRSARGKTASGPVHMASRDAGGTIPRPARRLCIQGAAEANIPLSRD